MKALERLDLSLDEVIHIRSVLTKAELESLPLDGNLKDDVRQGKICFLCMKTRFGFFTWGVRCQLCQQQVCQKCSKKMNIPLDHFSSVHPSSSSSAEMEAVAASSSAGPVSLPANIVQEKARRDDLQGPLLQVCTDCRQMVLEVIRAKTTARRFQMTKALFSKRETKEEVF